MIDASDISDARRRVGIFGACGRSGWQAPFIARYQTLGIPFFIPRTAAVLSAHERAGEAAQNLRQNGVVLYPVTHETAGADHLAEIGFVLAEALRAGRPRLFAFLVDARCTDPKASPEQISDSERMRALVRDRLAPLAAASSTVFLVETLDALLDLSVDLWEMLPSLDAFGFVLPLAPRA